MTNNNEKKINETLDQIEKEVKSNKNNGDVGDDVIDDIDNKKNNLGSQAMAVIKGTINTETKIFIDQFNEPYIAVNGDGSRVIRVSSEEFKNWLSMKLYEQGKIVGDETIKRVTRILSAKALHENNKYKLSVRTARDKDNNYWYDLGGKAARINADGWTIIDSPPILFRRFGHQDKQIEPGSGGNLLDFFKLVNLKNKDDEILLLAFIVTCFICGFPHVILIVHGIKGTAKTTLLRLIKRLVDPSGVDLFPQIKKIEQFVQTVAHNWVSVFDNLSSLKHDLSDYMCMASTGMGFFKRKHYTNDDDYIYKFKHVICINGINNVATKPDLLERSLLLELKRIDKSQRKTEEEINKEFANMKSKLLGACLDLVVKAIQIKQTINLDNLNRMADFSVWGYAIAEALGRGGDTFLKAYENNISKQNNEAIEASPIGMTIIELLKRQSGRIEATPTYILDELNKTAESLGIDYKRNKYWPKDARWLWRRLVEITPNLAEMGIEVYKDDSSIERGIIIEHRQAAESVNNDSSVNDDNNKIGEVYVGNERVDF